MKNSLGIVILNWNDFIQTEQLLKSLKNEKYKKFDIVLVDNFSNNHEWIKFLKKIRKIFKKNVYNINLNKPSLKIKIKKKSNLNLFLIRNFYNSGCTAGFNIGYSFLIQNSYDYSLRLDNDTTVTSKFIETNLNLLIKKKYIGVCPKVVYKQNPKLIQWAGAKSNILTFYLFRSMRTFNKPDHPLEGKHPQLNEKNYRGVLDTYTLNGPGMMLDLKSLKSVGLADEDFFFGPEDIELSRRLIKSGEIKVNLNSKIKHAITSSANISGYINRFYQQQKSVLLLRYKLGNPIQILLTNLIYFLKSFKFLISNNNLFILSLKAQYDFLMKNYGFFDIQKYNKDVKGLKKKYIKLKKLVHGKIQIL